MHSLLVPGVALANVLLSLKLSASSHISHDGMKYSYRMILWPARGLNRNGFSQNGSPTLLLDQRMLVCAFVDAYNDLQLSRCPWVLASAVVNACYYCRIFKL
jgi:hypothetical protein